jgi:hypothetical protein
MLSYCRWIWTLARILSDRIEHTYELCW